MTDAFGHRQSTPSKHKRNSMPKQGEPKISADRLAMTTGTAPSWFPASQPQLLANVEHIAQVGPGVHRWAVSAAFGLLVALHVVCSVFLLASARLYWYMEHPYLEYFVDLLAHKDDRHFKLIGTTFGCLGEMWSHVFGVRGVFGVDSEHFTWIFLLREVLEISTQIYQAHRSSQLIARDWINHCYVTIVVLNCWSTPALHLVLQRRHPQFERLACFVVDAMLNICASIALPLVVFLPYMLEYDSEQFSFDLALLYDDLRFVNLVSENQAIFAVSLVDCASKILPHSSVYLSLRCIAFLIERSPGSRNPKPRNHTRGPSPATAKSEQLLFRKRTIAPQSTPGSLDSSETSRCIEARRRLHALTGYHIVNAVFVLVGVALVIIHWVAIYRVDSTVETPGCKQVMHPWFATKYSCAVFEFNCYRSSAVTIGAGDLDFLDEQTLVSLLFTHCPALVVPVAIRNFPSLLGVEIYNCTITEWSKEASLSVSAHPRMVSAILAHVNMTELPDGMLEPLPELLFDIEISVTNLTTLPGDLHERWHELSVLYLEHSQITAFPETLLELNVYDLSLIGNQIETLPDLLSVQANYFVLALSHNPLKALPGAIADGLTIDFFALERTDIDELPEWTGACIGETAYLSGSPMCSRAAAAIASGSSAGASLDSAKYLCEQVDPRGFGRYPLEITQRIRTP